MEKARHPAYENEGPSNPQTLKELEEAKKAAGVTTSEQARQRARQEQEDGKYENVAMYIKGNKEVVAPAGCFPAGTRVKKRKGWLGPNKLQFIDDEGNFATVEIDYRDIASIEFDKENFQNNASQFMKELEKYGFDISVGGFGDPAYTIMKAEVDKYKEAQKDEFKKGQRAEDVKF